MSSLKTSSKFIGTLGLANRARKVALGELVIKSIQAQTASLVVLDEEIGQNMRKKILDKCETYEVPYIFVERAVFEIAFSTKNRKSCAILDKGFAKSLMESYKGNKTM